MYILFVATWGAYAVQPIENLEYPIMSKPATLYWAVETVETQ